MQSRWKGIFVAIGSKTINDASFVSRLGGAYREAARGTWVLAVLMGTLFGVWQALGSRMERFGSLMPSGLLGNVALLSEIAISAIVFVLVLLPLLHLVSKPSGAHVTSTRTGLWAMSNAKRRILVTGILFAVWLVWWAFLWPGALSRDSYTQVIQALELIPYSDAHPIAHTLAIQAVLEPALALTGSMDIAIASVTFVQALGFAVILGFCIDGFRTLGAPNWLLTASIVFFAANPFIGWMSVTLWKDVWLSAFLLAFATATTLVVQRARRGEAPSWKLLLLVAFAAGAAMLSKRTGVYVVVPTVLLVVLVVRAYRLRWLAAGSAGLAIYVGVHAALLALFNVAPAVETEAWSLPSQQIARTVQAHGPTLSEGEKREIERFFPETNLGEAYLPYISNPVKGALNGDVLAEDRGAFLALWGSLAQQYPRTYIEATLASTYGYWYPNTQYWMVMGLDWTAMVNMDAHRRPETVHLKEAVSETRKTATPVVAMAEEQVNTNLRHLPVLRWMLSPGAWTWALVLFAGIAVVRKKAVAVPGILVAALVWASCLLSPVYAEARYAFPVLLLIPLCAAAALGRPKPGRIESSKEEQTSESGRDDSRVSVN